jgi:heterodisulfide reductase subunit B
LSWSHKTECCGASFSIAKVEVVYRLVGEVLKAAKRAGADCIAVVCPLCQSNLDIRQADLQRTTSESFNLPIVYLSQLILLAQGKGLKEVSFDKHLVNPKPLLEKLS